MSFGFAVGDFLAVSSFAWTLYRSCKGASGEFEEVSREVITLHTGIKELEEDARNPESLLNREGINRKSELEILLRNCMIVLRELQRLVIKYKSLGTNHKRAWDRVKCGTEGVQSIREKLTFYAASITLFLTSLGTSALGRIKKKLDDLVAEIRAGKREPSILTLGEEDDEADDDSIWRTLKSDLADDGIPKQEIERHKPDTIGHLRDLVQRGDLEETGAEHDQRAETTAEAAIAASTSRPPPPSAETVYGDTDDGGTASETSTVKSVQDGADEGIQPILETVINHKTKEHVTDIPSSTPQPRENIKAGRDAKARPLAATLQEYPSSDSDDSFYHSNDIPPLDEASDPTQREPLRSPTTSSAPFSSPEADAFLFPSTVPVSPELRGDELLFNSRSVLQYSSKVQLPRAPGRSRDKLDETDLDRHDIAERSQPAEIVNRARNQGREAMYEERSPRQAYDERVARPLYRDETREEEQILPQQFLPQPPDPSSFPRPYDFMLRRARTLPKDYDDSSNTAVKNHGVGDIDDFIPRLPRLRRAMTSPIGYDDSSNTAVKNHGVDNVDDSRFQHSETQENRFPANAHTQIPPNPRFSNGASGFKFLNPEDIFSRFFKQGDPNLGDDEDIFAQFAGDASRTLSPRDSNSSLRPESPTVTVAEKPLWCTLEQLCWGTKKKIRVRRKIFDEVSKARYVEEKVLEIDVKPGYKAGTKIKFKGWGDRDESSTQDLHFTIIEVRFSAWEQPHPC